MILDYIGQVLEVIVVYEHQWLISLHTECGLLLLDQRRSIFMESLIGTARMVNSVGGKLPESPKPDDIDQGPVTVR